MDTNPRMIPKVLGADFELANSIMGRSPQSPRRAAANLLAQIDGYPRGRRGGSSIEFGRRFLESCGSSWYIDSDHLEGNLPEHLSAFDHPTILHGAGFAQARNALASAQSAMPHETQINLVANCTDGKTAWGHHLNVLVTRECFRHVTDRKPHAAGFFATHEVTSIPYTGQGLVGAANGRSACSFQLSQRADWFEEMRGHQTMHDRPLVNLRDESHAASDQARMHIIFFDMVLSPIANTLKAGTTQLVLAMIESGWVDPSLALDDPVGAASGISRDLDLKQQFATSVRRRPMTAVDIQRGIAELAGEFVTSGAAEGIVPDAERIVELWIGTLDLLATRDVEALSRRCDAWLKFLLLDRQRGRRGLSWNSPELKIADSLFGSLDNERSLFFNAAAAGCVDDMPSDDAIQECLSEPPPETRAYFRAHLLRQHGDLVSSMNWDRIALQVPGARHWWSVAEIPMPDPCRLNRSETEALFDEHLPIEELVDRANSMAREATVASIQRNGDR